MVAQYIATWPILDLCEETVLRSGAWVARRWWYQEVLDLEERRANSIFLTSIRVTTACS